MSPVVTENAASLTRTVVVDASAAPWAAATVVPGQPVGVPADAGRGADELAARLVPAAGEDTPMSTVVVVAADTAGDRFDALAEGVRRAGLPVPTWVPEAVAQAGAVLARGAGRPHLVVDARADAVELWAVRPSAAAGRVGAVRPVEVDGRVEDLLVGILRAKLGAVAAQPPGDEQDTSEWGRHLRDATRRLVADRSGHGRILVTVDGVEVSIESRELAEALVQAARRGVVDEFGPDADGASGVVVAGGADGLVAHLASALDAVVVHPSTGAALEGVAALVGAASAEETASADTVSADTASAEETAPAAASVSLGTASVSGGTSTDDEGETVRLVIPAHAVRSAAERPRWIVPALTSLVAVALVGAAATLVVHAVEPDRPVPAAAVVPAGAGSTPALSR